MSEKPDFGEPLTVDRRNPIQVRCRPGFSGAHTGAEQVARGVACTNACAGMVDPVAEIAALRDRLRGYSDAHGAIVAALSECQDERDALRARVAELECIAVALHPWSRRYCDGRSTYAPAEHNRATRKLLELGIALPLPDGAPWARDSMGRVYDELTDEEAAAVQSPSKMERMLWERIEALEASRARLAAYIRADDDAEYAANCSELDEAKAKQAAARAARAALLSTDLEPRMTDPTERHMAEARELPGGLNNWERPAVRAHARIDEEKVATALAQAERRAAEAQREADAALIDSISGEPLYSPEGRGYHPRGMAREDFSGEWADRIRAAPLATATPEPEAAADVRAADAVAVAACRAWAKYQYDEPGRAWTQVVQAMSGAGLLDDMEIAPAGRRLVERGGREG